MDITTSMRRIMRQHELSEPMVRAIFSGEGGAIIDCDTRTYNALADRRILHFVNSDLTAKGQDVLAALKAARGVVQSAAPTPVGTPVPDAVEGVVGTHAGVTNGCRPPEVLYEEVTYALQTRPEGGDWQYLRTADDPKTLDEAQETIDDIKALSEPGWEYRPVEIRRAFTALHHRPSAAADVEPGPVPARKLRSGCRIRVRGRELLVWKVTFNRPDLRVHAVPPNGENPDYWVDTMGINETADLVAVGPAVNIDGDPITV
ncbi:hypothetical protein [Streptomyces noursei]|uniref:hypothetical protein n=1 Tax=Streptomyces noursei TaxID=1971 RepID=UPI0016730293|nr:hypothetical protein [Streptomyces noursei]MCZ1021385.1 hypothetical protein [Streptomyces noursei]GGX56377.1 hypothetical protein GCM10010341_91150 [Streptomyces noursei]